MKKGLVLFLCLCTLIFAPLANATVHYTGSGGGSGGGTGSGGSQSLFALSLTTTDTAGNLFPYTYVGAGGNVAPAAPAWGVAASLSANTVLQGRWLFPSTLPTSGTLNLVSYCQANATSGTIKYTVSDGIAATNGTVDPSAVTLTGETQTSITVPGTASFMFRTATPLTHTTAAVNGLGVVAITFNTTGWTLAQILACNWIVDWE